MAGRFCYGVMAASAATFAFWSLIGVHAFPFAVEDAMFAGEGGGAFARWTTYLVCAERCLLRPASPSSLPSLHLRF